MTIRARIIAFLLPLAALSCDRSKTTETDWTTSCLLEGKLKGVATSYPYGRVSFDDESGEMRYEFWKKGNFACGEDVETSDHFTFWTIADADGKVSKGKYGVHAGGDVVDFPAAFTTLEIIDTDLAAPRMGIKGRFTYAKEKDHLDGSFTLRLCTLEGKPYKPKRNDALEPRDGPLQGKVGGKTWKASSAIAYRIWGDEGITNVDFSNEPLSCTDSSKNSKGAVVEAAKFGWGTGPKRSGKQLVQMSVIGGGLAWGWIEFEKGSLEKGAKLKGTVLGVGRDVVAKEQSFEMSGTFTAIICTK